MNKLNKLTLKAFNLGFIKVIGKEVKKTKTSIILEDVLELQLEPQNGRIICQPIDYPLNSKAMNTLKIGYWFLEYSDDIIKTIEPNYYNILGYVQTGINFKNIKHYMIN